MKCPKCGCDRIHRRRSADQKGSWIQRLLTFRVCCHNCLFTFRRLRFLKSPPMSTKSVERKKVA